MTTILNRLKNIQPKELVNVLSLALVVSLTIAVIGWAQLGFERAQQVRDPVLEQIRQSDLLN